MAVTSSSGPASAHGAAQRHGGGPWLVLAILCLGFFMILLDTTIVNIALPAMAADLNATLDQLLWIVNAYTLTYACLLITGGKIGDLYGPKRLFMAGLVLFTAASAACGFAQDPAQLVAARALQGVGGALLTPQTFGIWGAVAGLATIVGPTFGGWLVTALGWRWIFYVNLPIGIATLALAALFLPDLRFNREHRLDWPGTAPRLARAVPHLLRPHRGAVASLGRGLGSRHDSGDPRRRDRGAAAVRLAAASAPAP
jgi:MFS family permease